MADLPPHVWFVRSHRGGIGGGYYPARPEAWKLLIHAALAFVMIVLATLYLCGVAEDFLWIWLVGGALLFWRTIVALRRFLATHSDLSLTIDDVRAMRDRGD